MADRVSIADGNWTTAGTWAVVDTTSRLISNSTSSTALTTGNLDSATFTPGAITVSGICLKIANRASGSPTNTITVTLRNSTGGVDVTSVTANVSLLPECNTTDRQGGWHYFKFSANQTLLAATNYLVRCSLSSTSTAVSLATNGTANNWQRMLPTTTTGAPAAADDQHIVGVLDGASSPVTTLGARAVTMDSTAATDYGSATANNIETPGLTISNGGTLSYGTTASTNYLLRYSGFIVIYSGGTLNVGTTGTPIPITSTAILELDCASDNQFFMARRFGTLVMQGSPRTAGKNVIQCRLNTDEAAAQTVLGVDTDTGWLSGDQIAIAGTGVSATQHEVRTLASNATATTLTVTAGLTNAHVGANANTKMNAEIVLLTQNVTFRSVSSTNVTGIDSIGTGTLDLDWVAFENCGSTVSSGPSTLRFNATTANQTVDFCTFKNGELTAWTATGASAGGWSVQDTVVYNYPGSGAATATVLIPATTATDWVMQRITVMACSTGFPAAIEFADLGGTIDNINAVNAVGTGTGIILADQTLRGWTIDNINCRSNGGAGMRLNDGASSLLLNGTISNSNFSRNTAANAGGVAGSGVSVSNVTFDTCTFIGNNTLPGLTFRANRNTSFRILLKDCTFDGDATHAQNNGISWDSNGGMDFHTDWRIENCSFGASTGHSVADIANGSNGTVVLQVVLNGCVLGSAQEVASGASATVAAFEGAMEPGSYVSFHQHDDAVSHKDFAYEGTLTYETSTVDVTPAMKMTPRLSTSKLESNVSISGRGFLVAVDDGVAPTVTVKVQKDASYNGNQPRLILKANPALGYSDDVVLDTMTAGSGSFETLTGTPAAPTENGVLEFVVDCDGTAGNAFVDTWTVTNFGEESGHGLYYWFDALPLSAQGGTDNAGSAAVEPAYPIGG